MERCDHTSVGVVIENQQNQILLIERARFPFAIAAPAGHIDDHGGTHATALGEVSEEVGIALEESLLTEVVSQRRIENRCRREAGDHHVWTVFYAHIGDAAIKRSLDETKSADWYSRNELNELAATPRTDLNASSTLEPVWLEFFKELGLVNVA